MKIETAEESVTRCEKRIEKIQFSLRKDALTSEQRQCLHDEEKSLKKEVKAYEKELKSLRKENFKSALLSVAVLAVVYAVYHFGLSS